MHAGNDLEELGPRRLSTRLGRVIDTVQYKHVLAAVAAIVTSCAVYYYLASGTGHGLKDKTSLTDAFYFSIVTFTTLGYGDLLPVGFGRAVASLQAFAGVALMSLFIGKVASERQAALLLLIYTSDQQRRLSSFAAEIRDLSRQLRDAAPPPIELVRGHVRQLHSLRMYLIYQANQGRVADFGNGSALRNLYRAQAEFQYEIARVLRAMSILDSKVEEGLLKSARRNARLAELMIPFHLADRRATASLKAVERKMSEIEDWTNTTVTVRRLNQIRVLVPPKPWPRHFHKEAAVSLGVSQKLFRRCMDTLISQGKI